MRRNVLLVALLVLAAGARPAAADATCSSPLQGGEQLPQPQVDIAALSAQARRGAAVARVRHQPSRSRGSLHVPQITKLSTFSEAPAPAVMRIVYTPQDMAARECAAPSRRLDPCLAAPQACS
jgi:hypothetical protein